MSLMEEFFLAMTIWPKGQPARLLIAVSLGALVVLGLIWAIGELTWNLTGAVLLGAAGLWLVLFAVNIAATLVERIHEKR